MFPIADRRARAPVPERRTREPVPERRGRKSVTEQSPSVITGDVLGLGSFPDHGAIDVRRPAVQALMISRTNTTFLSESAGDADASTRR